MNQFSNTPPDGDFVRYVERLTAQSQKPADEANLAQPESAADLRQPTQRPRQQITAFADSGRLARPDVGAAFEGIHFFKHLRWLFAAWVLTQVAGRAVPGADWLILPILVFYAIWIVIRIDQNQDGKLLRDLRSFLNSQNLKLPTRK